jgi:hypothetical protein
MTGATSGAGTAILPERLSSPPVFSGVRVTLSLVLCICFVDCYLSFFFWPLCCMSFDYLITPLVSSNSSYPRKEPNLQTVMLIATDYIDRLKSYYHIIAATIILMALITSPQ